MVSRRAVLFLFLSTILSTPVQAQSDPVGEGDIIITEILYSSEAADTDREYVEVYNTTDKAINLENWKIVEEDPSTSNPSDDVIDKSVQLAAGEFAVLCENSDASENGGVQCAFDYVNTIDHKNTSDIVVLEDADGNEIDRVRYNEDSGWPDAAGASLEYVAGPDDANNDATNWEAATVRTGDFAEVEGADYGSPNTDAPEGALPVEFAAFEVTREGDQALIRWTTASETGNAGFAVQHRRRHTDTWQKRGFVSGQGTSDEPHSYRYDTGSLEAGVHAFRLKQVDVDGAIHFSNTRMVEIPQGGRLLLHGPNPLRVGQPLSVTVGSGLRADQLVLYNVLGQRVRTVSLNLSGGEGGRVDLSTVNLSSGTYFLRAEVGGSEFVRQFTVIR